MAVKFTALLQKMTCWQHFLLKFGLWPDSNPKTYFYLRLKYQSTAVIVKLLNLPYKSRDIRVLDIPKPVDLKLHQKWCKATLKITWDGPLICNIDGHTHRFIIPSMAAVPLPLRRKALSICHQPCQIKLFYKNDKLPHIMPVKLTGIEPMAPPLGPQPAHMAEEQADFESFTLLPRQQADDETKASTAF